MMYSVYTVLWLCLTCRFITAEPDNTANTVQGHWYDCHHYMSQTARTDCLFEQLTSRVNQVNDKLNGVVASVEQNDKHFNEVIDGVHGVTSSVEGKIDTVRKDILSEVEDISTNFNDKMTKFDETMAEVRGKIEELKSESQHNVRSRSTSINQLNSSMFGDMSTMNKTVNKMIEEVKNDIKKEFGSLNQQIDDLNLSTNSKMHKMDNTILGTGTNISAMEQRVERMERTEGAFQADVSGLKDSVKDVKTHMESFVDSRYNELIRQMNEKNSVVKKSLENSDGDNTEKFAAHAAQISEISQKLDSAVSKLESTFTSRLNTLKSELDVKFSESEAHVKRVQKSTQDKMEDLEAANRHLSLSIEINKETAKNEMENAIQKLQQQMTNDFDKKLGKLESDMATMNNQISNEMETAIQNLQQQMTNDLDKKLEKLESGMANMKNQISDEIRKQAQNLSAKTSEVNQTVTQQQSTLNVVYANAFDKGMLILAILLLFVFIGINYFIVYIIVKRTKPVPVSSSNLMSRSLTLREPRSPTEVRNWFGMHEPLANTVCVISFSEQSEKCNKKLMKSLHEELPADYYDKVKYHVIRRHEDIPETPVVKLCFMFVEFTERHVIIEEPGLGLGDLKRKTFTYVTESGGCLVIIYVKDPESRRLSDEDLYNNKIHCVSSQAELVSLRQQDRFISIYDKFNVGQSKCLLTLIRDYIK